VRTGEGAGDFQLPAQEVLHEALQELLRQPGVGVEEDHDVARSATAAQVPTAGYRGFPVEDPHPSEPLCHGDRGVARAGVHHDDLPRSSRLASYVPEQAPNVSLLVERRHDDAHGAPGGPRRSDTHDHAIRARRAAPVVGCHVIEKLPPGRQHTSSPRCATGRYRLRRLLCTPSQRMPWSSR
jgi:hypothetical protein